MGGHRRLRVWRAGVDLALAVYRLTEGFPRHEMFGLSSQMRRAAVSISANIAEGANRGGSRELRQFLLIARGSLAELETFLILARELRYADSISLEAAVMRCSGIERQLNALLSTLQ